MPTVFVGAREFAGQINMLNNVEAPARFLSELFPLSRVGARHHFPDLDGARWIDDAVDSRWSDKIRGAGGFDAQLDDGFRGWHCA